VVHYACGSLAHEEVCNVIDVLEVQATSILRVIVKIETAYTSKLW
jgi:hypothetical protein